MAEGISGIEDLDDGRRDGRARVRRVRPGATLVVRCAWVVVGALCGLLLAGACVVGTYARLAGDDWIAASEYKANGLFGPAQSFFTTTNGRLANGLVSAIVFSHGPAGERILPAVIICTLVASLYAISTTALRRTGVVVPRLAQLVGVLVVVVLYLLGGPNTYQVLFWGAGAITHTVPTAAGAALLALVMVLETRPSARRRALALGLVALSGLFLGSVSEPFVAVAGVYGLAALGVVWRLSAPGRGVIVAYLLTWLASLALGFSVVLLSPGRAHRQERDLHLAPLFSPGGIKDVVRQTSDVWAWLLHQPAYLAAVALGVAAGIALARQGLAPVRLRWLAAAVGLAVLASGLVVVGLRAGYGDGSSLDFARAWENFLLPWLLSVTLIGVWLGTKVAERRSSLVTGLAGLVAALAVLAVIPDGASTSRMVVHRTAAWDRQDRAMVRAVSEGARVFAYTPRPSQDGISEPFYYLDLARDWPARCIATYYGFDAVVPSTSWLRSRAAHTFRHYWRTHSPRAMDPRVFEQFVKAGLLDRASRRP